MNVKLRVLSAGVLFFMGGQAIVAQENDSIPRTQEIEEVTIVNVQVGYSPIKKEQVSGAVSSVTAEDLENVPGATIQQALTAKAPGVDVSFGSGAPGSSNFRVDVRGTSTINGTTTPLYILDGVPISYTTFASLDPNSFEVVDILRDYASTAQYGSAGGNGVLILTTKKGRKRRNALITYTGQAGVGLLAEPNVDLMNSFQYHTFRQQTEKLNPYTKAAYQPGEIEELGRTNTDWSDLFLGTGFFTQHTFSVNGGSEDFNYHTQLGYYNQGGMIKNSDFERTTATINLGVKPSEKFELQFNNQLSYSIQNGVSSEAAINLNNPIAAAYLARPSDTPYLENGDYNSGPGLVGGNAFETIDTQVSETTRFKIVSGVTGIYRFNENLSARQFVGIDHTISNSEGYLNPDTYLGGITTPGNKGRLSRGNSQISNIINNTSLNYNKTFGEMHNVDLLALYEYRGIFTNSMSYAGYGLSNLYTNSPSAILVSASTLPSVGGGSMNFHNLGFVGIGRYTFNDKYTVNGTIRRESASSFGANHKWGTFYSAGLSWQMHKENFLNDVRFINTLKPRFSYGHVGNIPNPLQLSPYENEPYWGTSGTNYAGNQYLINTLPGNPDYKWEVGDEINVGIDFEFFKRRLSGSFDYYNRETSDLYVSKTLSGTTGFSSISSFNAGKMENKGIEIALNADIVRTNDFTWNVFGNFAKNKNEITDLGEVNEYESGTSIVKVGEPFGSHYIVGWAGVDASNGQPLYYDLNGNVTNQYIETNATTGWGSYKPEIWGGFGTTLTYRGLSLSALFRYKAKYFRFNNQTFFMENPNFANDYNQSTVMLDMWTTPGQITDIQSYRYPREFSSKDIEDASFLRLQEARVTYRFNRDLIGDALSGLEVFLVGNNLVTWTKWTGIDPDDSNNIGTFEYPFATTITLGASINF